MDGREELYIIKTNIEPWFLHEEPSEFQEKMFLAFITTMRTHYQGFDIPIFAVLDNDVFVYAETIQGEGIQGTLPYNAEDISDLISDFRNGIDGTIPITAVVEFVPNCPLKDAYKLLAKKYDVIRINAV